jgi:hypothetical protein
MRSGETLWIPTITKIMSNRKPEVKFNMVNKFTKNKWDNVSFDFKGKHDHHSWYSTQQK